MPVRKLSNIPVVKFRKFLESQGLKVITGTRGRGGHEKWSKRGMDRPVTIQTHIDPARVYRKAGSETPENGSGYVLL